MRFTGQAIVLVGCTDREAAASRDDADVQGENAWGPFPAGEAQKIADDINNVWMNVLADVGLSAFPYGPPHATVHRLVGARSRVTGDDSDDRVDVIWEAARNWVRVEDGETLGQYIARHPVLGSDEDDEPPLGLHRLAPGSRS